MALAGASRERLYPGALAPTPSQTIGPYFGFALDWEDGPLAVAADDPAAIRIEGRLLDGAGEPVPDGMIETWQADPEGRTAHPDDPRGAVDRQGFRGFARCATGSDGEYALLTLKPGSLPGPGGVAQAPHLVMSIFARGLLQRLVTRVYFGDEQERNEADPVLSSLRTGGAPWSTLIAAPSERGYHFDLRMQGADETVFFAI